MTETENRRGRLIREYTLRLSVLVWGIILLTYSGSIWSSIQGTVNQVRMLTIEETEEAENEPPGTGEEEILPENHSKYYRHIFFYSYDDQRRLVNFFNGMPWSREDVLVQMEDMDFPEDWPRFQFLPYEGHSFRAYVMMWHTVYYGGEPRGQLYAGIDITGTVREMLRFTLLVCLIGVLSFFIVRRSAEKLAADAVAPLEESLRKQRQFTDSASHELRTPLAVVMSGMNILEADEKERLSPKGQEIMGDMKKAVREMKQLIQDMLRLSRLDAGKRTVHKEILQSMVCLKEAADTFRLQAEEKDITLTVSGEEMSFQADPSQVKAILALLTDNAVKYTKPGGTVSLVAREEGKWVVLEVSDTGIGILPEDLPHIFERFYRSAEVHSQEGSGLGLSVAMELVRQNEGAIAVSSEPGKGSCFQIRLPKRE